MKTNTIATVFIPTYNGEQYLRQLLDAVFSQQLKGSFEVLIIDSGSSDNTLSIIAKYPNVVLHQIPNSEFGHGKTRNLAAKMAKGEFMVYLSQDAVPASNRWLEFMIEPFELSNDVFCVFGKQIPRPFADATTKREVHSVFQGLGPDHSLMIHRQRSLLTEKQIKPYLTFFSDVNSAVRRDYLLNKLPYRDIRYAEDQFLGKDVLENNYLKVYAPMGVVLHSNEYKIRDYFYRKFDENLGIYETLGILPSASKKHHLKLILVDTIKDCIFIIRDKDFSMTQKIRLYPSSFVRNVLKQRAAYIIANPSLRKKYGLRYSLEARNNLKNN